VTPKSPQEAVKIEKTNNKDGCWVRNQDGQLVFLSNQAPNQNHRPMITDPANALDLPAAKIGKSGSALGAAAVIGTWRESHFDKECGIQVWGVLTIYDRGGTLAGTSKVLRPVWDSVTSKCLPPELANEPLTSVSFDGHTLSISWNMDLGNGYHEVEHSIGQLSGNKLIFDDGAGYVETYTKDPPKAASAH
jgi:hypothetical protein